MNCAWYPSALSFSLASWQSLPAANAEHESVGAGRFRVVAEELCAPGYLIAGLRLGHVGAYTHFSHYFFLKFTHTSSVRGRRFAEGTKDNADTLKIHRIFCSKDLIYRCF